MSAVLFLSPPLSNSPNFPYLCNPIANSHYKPTSLYLYRKLQGLAAAILKLWENCHIAKIAVKLRILNTNNEEMANELKFLTGGVLLLRNKFFIIIYRGKDFLPRGVANLVAEREMELKRCELQEEAARLKPIGTICLTVEPSINTSTIGTLSEFRDIQSCGDLEDGNKEVKVQLEAEKGRLDKLNTAWRPAEPDKDQEIITPEEREGFRKIGLKMDSSLVLGKQELFFS